MSGESSSSSEGGFASVTKGAHCSGCGRRVPLTESGKCPQGHLRSMLRDVREVAEPAEIPNVESRTTVRGPGVGASAPPSARQSQELLSAVIGKAFIIVPVAAVVAFGLWTGYVQAVDTGMSVGGALFLSVVSLAATVGGAFVWSAMTRRKH